MNVFTPSIHKRASRWDDQATTRLVAPTARDLEYLYSLFIHGPLSSAMLRALIAPACRQKDVTTRLMILKRKPNAFIQQPWQQRHAFNANYNPLIYALSATGLQALLEQRRITRQQAQWYLGINDNRKAFDHETMAAYVSASLDLGCRQNGLCFISWLDIFEHSKCPQQTKSARNPFLIPYTIDRQLRALIPDGLCAVQTAAGINFYALEADRNNEPIETSNLTRSSYARHIQGYRHALRKELYKIHYGVPNLQVLNVTVSELHMINIIAHLKRVTAVKSPDLTGSHPFLFKSVPELGRRINKPPVDGAMLTSAWRRVGEDNVTIAKS